MYTLSTFELAACCNRPHDMAHLVRELVCMRIMMTKQRST